MSEPAQRRVMHLSLEINHLHDKETWEPHSLDKRLAVVY